MPVELQLPFLQSAVVPLALAIVLMAIGWWRSTHQSAVRQARFGASDASADPSVPMPVDALPRVAGAVTLTVVSVITGAWVLWSPGLLEGGWRVTSAEKWIPWAAILAGAVAIVSSVLPRNGRGVFVTRVIAAFTLTFIVVAWSFVGGGAWRWPAERPEIMTFVLALVFGTSLWYALRSLLNSVRGVEAGLSLVILCTAISIVLVVVGSAKHAQIAGALGAASGGVCVVALFRPRLALFGAAMIVCPLLSMLLYQSVLYTDGHTRASAVLFLLPLVIALGTKHARSVRKSSGVVPVITRLAMIALGAIIVVAVIASSVPTPEAY